VNPVARTVIVGSVESRERKKIGDKNLAEFRIEGFGLKLNAWGELATKVPESGLVLVEGALKTREYQVDGKDRRTTEMTVSSIEILDVGGDSDLPF
jgi:single-stranded DNA-binding protein